jgi:hypothetical protein
MCIQAHSYTTHTGSSQDGDTNTYLLRSSTLGHFTPVFGCLVCGLDREIWKTLIEAAGMLKEMSTPGFTEQHVQQKNNVHR